MKQYHRYKMDFSAKSIWFSTICMGASLFLLVLHYLAFRYFTDTPMWELTVFLWIPAFLGIGYVILLRIVRLNAPGVYAILGVLICMLMLVWECLGGNTMHMVLFGILYILSGVVLILASGGFIPGRLPAFIVFAIVFVLRLVFTDFDAVSIARLGILASLMLLPLAMIPGREKGAV